MRRHRSVRRLATAEETQSYIRQLTSRQIMPELRKQKTDLLDLLEMVDGFLHYPITELDEDSLDHYQQHLRDTLARLDQLNSVVAKKDKLVHRYLYEEGGDELGFGE